MTSAAHSRSPCSARANLGADWRFVRGKRQQPHLPAGFDQPIAQPLSLGLLTALVQAFEGDQQAAHRVPGCRSRFCSGFERKDIVERLPSPNDIPPVVIDEHFRREEPAIVIGRHDRAVRARCRGRRPDRRRAAPAATARARTRRCFRRSVRRRPRGARRPCAETPARCGETIRTAPGASARSCPRRGPRTACRRETA